MSQSFVTLPEIERAARRRLPRDALQLRRRRRRDRDDAPPQPEAASTASRSPRTSSSTSARSTCRHDLLGVPLSWPVAVAPMGGLILFHPEGDVEMARGAGQGRHAPVPVRRHRLAGRGRGQGGTGPKMFQLYHHGDRGWVRRAARPRGGVGLSVRVPDRGRAGLRAARARHRHRWSPRNAMEIAPNPRGPNSEYQARLTWDDVEWLMKATRLPVGIKGIMTVRDARRAVEMGVRFIWVSNHGGRQLDQTQSTIDALPPDRRGGGRRASDRGRRRLRARDRRGQGPGARRRRGRHGARRRCGAWPRTGPRASWRRWTSSATSSGPRSPCPVTRREGAQRRRDLPRRLTPPIRRGSVPRTDESPTRVHAEPRCSPSRGRGCRNVAFLTSAVRGRGHGEGRSPRLARASLGSFGRMAEPVCDAGFRIVHFPASTAVRKSSRARLKASGSSRLIVCPDFGNHDQPRRADLPLHEDRGLEARLVLVARHDQRGHVEPLEPRLELVDRGPLHLHAAHGQRVARGSRRELVVELQPAPRVLVDELHPRRPARVHARDLRHALGLEPPHRGLRGPA